MPCRGGDALIYWKGVPAKVKEIYYAIRRDNPNYPKELAIRVAWAKYKGEEGPPYSAPLTKYPRRGMRKRASLDSALAMAYKAEKATLREKKKYYKKLLASMQRAKLSVSPLKDKLTKYQPRGLHSQIRAIRRFLEARKAGAV